MFTGLIGSVGKLSVLTAHGNYRILTIRAELAQNKLELGESIACDGVCLTVTKFDRHAFTVEASQETLARSIMKHYVINQKINLERALQVGDRLGGHFVSGHVDTVGRVSRIQRIGKSLRLDIKYPPEQARYLIEKGSIAINGISLTVNECRSGFFSVNLIPHSVANTNIESLKKGDDVNLEYDQLGKYVLNSLSNNNDALLVNKLKESGWAI